MNPYLVFTSLVLLDDTRIRNGKQLKPRAEVLLLQLEVVRGFTMDISPLLHLFERRPNFVVDLMQFGLTLVKEFLRLCSLRNVVVVDFTMLD